MVSESELEQLKREKVELLENKVRISKGLPHLYGWKWYDWARSFFESMNRFNFLCAANQVSKSSTMIRKAIHWSTSPELWPKLWKNVMLANPDFKPVFWYFYPSQDLVDQEFETKWVQEFLPRGEFKDHSQYGWKKKTKSKQINAIFFNSGAKIYFKTYGQKMLDLGAGTCAGIFCDEELPTHIYPEIVARMYAVDGFFHMVFTATLGQLMWRDTMEGEGDIERFKNAWKRQISMYQCLYYEDGSKSHWSREKIEEIKQGCKNSREVARRVYGKFVLDENLKYPTFDPGRNYVPYPKDSEGNFFKGVPKGWTVYAGIDLGSGGKNNHPTAYVFVSVSPDYKKLRVFKGRRLDGIETTSADSLKYYIEDRGKMSVAVQTYDWASKDFGIISGRMGEPFVKANKDHVVGEDQMNILFKSGMLKIYRCDENEKLVNEIMNVTNSTSKTQARDDFVDALRYTITAIPINYEAIVVEEEKDVKKDNDFNDRRRGDEPEKHQWKDELEQEFAEWNELYG